MSTLVFGSAEAKAILEANKLLLPDEDGGEAVERLMRSLGDVESEISSLESELTFLEEERDHILRELQEVKRASEI